MSNPLSTVGDPGTVQHRAPSATRTTSSPRSSPRPCGRSSRSTRSSTTRSTPVPTDDAMADRIWKAGWELFREVGLYNTDTHRIIQVTDEEIREALYATSDQLQGRRGQGRRAVEASPGRGHRAAVLHLLRPTAPARTSSCSTPYCLSFLKEPLLDGFCAPILEDAMGQKIRSASPFEINGCTEHIYKMRLAAKQVGRPGNLLRGRRHRRTRRRPDRRVRQRVGRADHRQPHHRHPDGVQDRRHPAQPGRALRPVRLLHREPDRARSTAAGAAARRAWPWPWWPTA